MNTQLIMLRKQGQTVASKEEIPKPCCDDHKGENRSFARICNKMNPIFGQQTSRTRTFSVIVLLFTLLLTGMMMQHESQHVSGKKELESLAHSRKRLLDLSIYDNCTLIKPPARLEPSWSTKPLWFPSYPNSIDDKILKTAISDITGLSAGAKSFYASMAGLRQCMGRTETASCLNIHPMVLMNTDPTQKVNLFASPIVYTLRNPATAIPAFLNGKRIRYAKISGQTPIDEWRRNRDEWLSDLMEGYIQQLRTWHDYTSGTDSYYTIGMYLVWEHWMDPDRGPAQIQRLASLLSKQGFATASMLHNGNDNALATCIWYRSIGGKKVLERFYHEQHEYDFSNYLPGFTEEQKAMMVDGLLKLVKDYNTDKELVQILTEYADKIREYPNDVKWVNQTEQMS